MMGSVTKAQDEIDLIDYIRVVWRHKWSVLISAIGAAALLGGLSFLMPNYYRAEVLMAPANDDSQRGLSASGILGALGAVEGIIGQTGVLSSGNQTSQEYLAVLRSRNFVWELVEDEQLMPVLFADEWNAAASSWRDPETAPTRWDAYELIVEDGMLSVVSHEESGLFTLAVEWTDPELAADLANKLVARLNAYLRAGEQKRTSSNLAYLNAELARTNVAEIRQSLFSLITEQLNKAMLVNTQQEFAFRVIDPAVAPEEHVWPQRLLLAILAGVLGAILAIFYVFFAEGSRRQRLSAVDV